MKYKDPIRIVNKINAIFPEPTPDLKILINKMGYITTKQIKAIIQINNPVIWPK